MKEKDNDDIFLFMVFESPNFVVGTKESTKST